MSAWIRFTLLSCNPRFVSRRDKLTRFSCPKPAVITLLPPGCLAEQMPSPALRATHSHTHSHTLTHMLTVRPIHVSVFPGCLSYSCALVSLHQTHTHSLSPQCPWESNDFGSPRLYLCGFTTSDISALIVSPACSNRVTLVYSPHTLSSIEIFITSL